MARRKRSNSLLQSARKHLSERWPELKEPLLRLRALDGPPGAPRYSVTVEVCHAGICAHGIPPTLAQTGDCPVYACPLRCSVRLLLDRRGSVLQETQSTVHWGQGHQQR